MRPKRNVAKNAIFLLNAGETAFDDDVIFVFPIIDVTKEYEIKFCLYIEAK